MSNNNVLEILVNGKPIRQFAHENRVYVEGREGQEFSLRVKNNHPARKLFNVSIDSINVVDGTQNSSQGYIIQGYSSYEIKGWRTNNNEVATFKFTKKKNSYSAKSSETNFSTQDCGVIGLRLFSEKEKPYVPPVLNEIHHYHNQQPIQWWNPPYQPYSTWTCNSTITRDDTTSSYNCGLADNIGAKGMGAGNLMNSCDNAVGAGNLGESITANFMSIAQNTPIADFDLGTAWGDTKTDYVTNTEFEKGLLLETVEIFYASRQSLILMGVDLSKSTQVSFPRAFPNGFCSPPK